MSDPQTRTFFCPVCQITIEVLASVSGAFCDGGGKHRTTVMMPVVEMTSVEVDEGCDE